MFKPRGTLKELNSYKTKIELASSIVTELIEFGFNIDLVLADSLYGEASSFIRTLDKHNLPWVLAIRSNHGVWLSPKQKVRANKWCKFKRTFSDQKSETRYIRVSLNLALTFETTLSKTIFKPSAFGWEATCG